MTIDTDKIVTEAIREGFRDGFKEKMRNGYNNPFDKIIAGIIESNADRFRDLLTDALKSCAGDAEFREEIRVAVRHTMAKQLVSKFGGELEKSRRKNGTYDPFESRHYAADQLRVMVQVLDSKPNNPANAIENDTISA